MRISGDIRARVVRVEEIVRQGLIAFPGEVIMEIGGAQIPCARSAFESLLQEPFEIDEFGVYHPAGPSEPPQSDVAWAAQALQEAMEKRSQEGDSGEGEPSKEAGAGEAPQVGAGEEPAADGPVEQPDDAGAPAEAVDVSQFHLGAGWYQLPDGRKVRGEDKARAALASAERE